MAITLQTIESLPLVEEVNENTSLVGWDGEKTVRVASDAVGESLPTGNEPNQYLITDADGEIEWKEDPIVTTPFIEEAAINQDTITWDGTFGDKPYITLNGMKLYKVSDTVLSIENIRIAEYEFGGEYASSKPESIKSEEVVQSDNGIAYGYMVVSGNAGSINTDYGTKTLPETGTYVLSNDTQYQRYVSKLTYGIEYGEVTTKKNVGLKLNLLGENNDVTKETGVLSTKGKILTFKCGNDQYYGASPLYLFGDSNRHLRDFNTNELISSEMLFAYLPCQIVVLIVNAVGTSLRSAVNIFADDSVPYITVKTIDHFGAVEDYYTSEYMPK